MRNQAVDRTGQMEIFCHVVELGGFSAAAHHMKIAPSTVSKLITRLEGRLNAKLLHRSTRGLRLTDEGRAFYRRCSAILSEIQAAEEEAAAGEIPAGRLRVSVSVPVGLAYILPVAAGFAERNPQVCIDFFLSDRIDDLVSGDTDIAIRTGPLPASSLIARKLGESPYCVVGAPDYLAAHRAPDHPGDLDGHTCLDFTFPRLEAGWPFTVDGERRHVRPHGKLRASDGEAVRRLALAGAGLARLARFQVADDLAAGRLQEVLSPFNPGDRLEIFAVYSGGGAKLPVRSRAFIDYLAQTVRVPRTPPP